MAIPVKTPAAAVAAFLESRNFDAGGVKIRVGSRFEEELQICCTDAGEKKDGVVQGTGEELTTPKVQVRIRVEDYREAHLLAKRVSAALSSLSQDDLYVVDFPDAAYLLATVYIASGPLYMGQDPKPGQLFNFSLNTEVTLTPF